MARECKKCGAHVPKHVWVDGKKRNCQRRKYCLLCSPFGEHNTAKLEQIRTNGNNVRIKICPICKQEHYQKAKKCFNCSFKEKHKNRRKQVADLVDGFKCWICGYNKTKYNICFHHVHDDKLFGLSTREMLYAWEKVEKELRKCIIVCSNCHGEIHHSLIEPSFVENLWQQKWNEINKTC